MCNHLFQSAAIAFCIVVIALNHAVNANDYDNDAYPDEERRIGDSALVNEANLNHRNEKREDGSQPLGMKTSTVIEISADDANKANQEEATISHTPNTKMQAPITIKKAPKVISKGKGKEKTVLKQQLPQKPSRVVVDVKEKKDKNDPHGKKKWETDLVVEGKAKKVPDEVIEEVIDDESNSPSEEVIDVKDTNTKTEEIIDVEGEKEEVIEMEPVTETSEEVIEVVKPPKPKVIEVIKSPNGEREKIVEVEPPPLETPEVIEVESPKGKKGEVVVEKVVETPEGPEEVIEVESPKGRKGDMVEKIIEAAETPEVIEIEPSKGKKGGVVEKIIEKPEKPDIIEVESSKSRQGDVIVEKIKETPEVIDIENLGKNNKVTTALKENRHEILEDLRGGLTPDLIHWAEEAIAAGIENVVNAVEDKYIAYMKSRTRRKRAAEPSERHKDKVIVDIDDEAIRKTSSKTLKAAMKKVQKAAAVLATSEAHNAAKAASDAARLNMDVTSQAASDAMKSVASAIGAASQNAAKQIVEAENRAAAAALAGAAPVIVAAAGASQSPPIIVTDAAAAPAVVEEAVIEAAAARPPPIIVTDGSAASEAAVEEAAAAAAGMAAGAGAGRDLISQTLQIQKGLNLVMRAVLKEKERVAADLARYQNKISFLLREMAGAPAGGVGTARRRRRREVRRQRRALLSTQHLHQLLEREEERVGQMLRLLDTGLGVEKRKRGAEAGATCRGEAKKRRTGHTREAKCIDVG